MCPLKSHKIYPITRALHLNQHLCSYICFYIMFIHSVRITLTTFNLIRENTVCNRIQNNQNIHCLELARFASTMGTLI